MREVVIKTDINTPGVILYVAFLLYSHKIKFNALGESMPKNELLSLSSLWDWKDDELVRLKDKDVTGSSELLHFLDPKELFQLQEYLSIEDLNFATHKLLEAYINNVMGDLDSIPLKDLINYNDYETQFRITSIITAFVSCKIQ